MRRDIQFLRGIAVLFVVLYHSGLGILGQGYLGVDVFFVLSGFLITTIILKSLEGNSFKFSVFYLRRAKRLLPALYCTLVFTSVAGLWVLTPSEWLDYSSQLVGALTFTANMVLPIQSGYFDPASEGKPLLHIWSLSLEEQYYFLLPITLFLLPKRFRLGGILVLFLISIIWCLSWVYSETEMTPFLWRIADSSRSEWAFFLLFTRAWELLGGSICAYIVLHYPKKEAPKWAKIIALGLIFVICSIDINSEHPSLESILVVFATMLILIGSTDWLFKNKVMYCIEKLGDWSYSVYLVHWPLFAYAYLSYVAIIPTSVKLFLVVCSIVLGFLQYKYVETPFRLGKFERLFTNWKLVAITTLIFLAIPTSSFFIRINDSELSASAHSQPNVGLSDECEGSFDKSGKLKDACKDIHAPSVVVWGDSYAMHLVPGLAANPKNSGLVQLTKSTCGPILGLAPINARHNVAWAEGCNEFNQLALEYIKDNKSITHVVFSSVLTTYLKFDEVKYLTSDGIYDANFDVFIETFKNTIREIEALGIVAIIISPTPKAGFNIGSCLNRKSNNVLLLRDNCTVNFNNYLLNQTHENSALELLEKNTNVIWLKDLLCAGETCTVENNGINYFIDEGHLTVEGSVELLKKIDILSYQNKVRKNE